MHLSRLLIRVLCQSGNCSSERRAWRALQDEAKVAVTVTVLLSSYASILVHWQTARPARHVPVSDPGLPGHAGRVRL